MARPLRIQYPGAFYHVLNRGANRDPIFLDALHDRLSFKEVLADAVSLWKIKIHAYALMDNHYHLLIETPRANLSRAMRHIDGVYTQRFNKQRGRDGALLRGRYKSILIQRDSYLLELVRYIHLNGVRASIFRSPRFDVNSSHPDYLFPEQGPRWLTTDLVLSLLGGHHDVARIKLDQFVNQGVPDELRNILEKPRWPAVLGSDEFVGEIKDRFNIAQPPHKEKPQEKELELRQKPYEPRVLIKNIATLFSVKEADILGRGNGRPNEARSAAMYFLRTLSQLAYSEIGKILGDVGETAVTMGIKRVRCQKEKALEEWERWLLETCDL